MRKEKIGRPQNGDTIKISAKERAEMKAILNAEEKPNGTVPKIETKTGNELNLYIPSKWNW